MAILLFVYKCSNDLEVYKIYYNSIKLIKNPQHLMQKLSNNCGKGDASKEMSDEPENNNKQLKFKIDGQSFYFLLKELFQYNNFRKYLYKTMKLDQKTISIQIVPPLKQALDYKWNEITQHSVWEKVEIENMMSWLSTLGGGFSALGEKFSHCAETAGKISLRQLKLGLRVGDPFVQARCKLYYSISLIQMDNLKDAKRIIRQQYKFAIDQIEIDHRLVNMCRGIWLKLQYSYYLKLLEKDPTLSPFSSTI